MVSRAGKPEGSLEDAAEGVGIIPLCYVTVLFLSARSSYLDLFLKIGHLVYAHSIYRGHNWY